MPLPEATQAPRPSVPDGVTCAAVAVGLLGAGLALPAVPVDEPALVAVVPAVGVLVVVVAVVLVAAVVPVLTPVPDVVVGADGALLTVTTSSSSLAQPVTVPAKARHEAIHRVRRRADRC